jgi:hypothetical protein
MHSSLVYAVVFANCRSVHMCYTAAGSQDCVAPALPTLTATSSPVARRVALYTCAGITHECSTCQGRTRASHSTCIADDAAAHSTTQEPGFSVGACARQPRWCSRTCPRLAAATGVSEKDENMSPRGRPSSSSITAEQRERVCQHNNWSQGACDGVNKLPSSSSLTAGEPVRCVSTTADHRGLLKASTGYSC